MYNSDKKCVLSSHYHRSMPTNKLFNKRPDLKEIVRTVLVIF